MQLRILGAVLLAAPGAALAQDAAPPRTAQVDDVIVTAQRREQSVGDVPGAVTALTADDLAAREIVNLDRIGAAVPNLYIARNFGTSSGALVFLRGVGEGDSIFTNDPPVGIYVDDVILPRSTGSLLDLIDVERVEVLRGPQGTLYGRNTSGGAIKVVTRRPTFDSVSGEADIAVGSYARVDARATLNLPIASTLAVRMSGLSRNSRGWGRNLTDGARVNGQDTQGLRASLLWEPSDALSVLATADVTLDRSGPRFPQRFVPDSTAPGRFTNRFVTPGGDVDAFTSADTAPLGRTDTGGASLRIDYRLGWATLSSITGYRALRSEIGFDQTANAPGVGSNIILLQDQHGRSFSQELQLAGSSLGGRLEWLAGLYYFAEHNDQLTAVSFATPVGSPMARFRTDDFFVAASRGAGTSGNWSPYEPRLDTRSVSAFGSATLDIGTRTHVTAGLRLTDERKRYGVRFLTAPDTVLVLADGRRAEREIVQSWTDVSPRLALDHRVRPGVLAYASVAKGFRSGSFDGRARNIPFVLERQGAIAPESVWSYEAGVKADLLGRRVRVAADYFINDYRDIAFSAARANSTPPEIFRQNVGDARISGLEVEWTARLSRDVEFGGWVATLADRFTRLASSPGCTAFVPDERDLDLRFTPTLRYGVRANLSRSVGRARLTLGGDYSAASPYTIALCNEPQHRVTNASAITLQAGADVGAWRLSVSATNLADRRYNTGSVASIGYPVAPREILARLARRF